MKSNQLKRTSLLPFIVIMLLLQNKTIAQVKKSDDKKTSTQQLKAIEKEGVNISEIKTKVAIKIEATSKSEDLNKNKSFFKETFGVVLNFSEIKRNDKNEIIAIKVELNDTKGNKKIYEIEGLKPIKTFEAFVEKDEKENLETGFNEVKEKK